MIEFLFRLVAALPLSLVHRLGAALGSLVYWASGSYRRRLHENLRQAGYAPEQWAREARREAGRQALETPWIWMRPRSQVMAKVQADETAVAVIRDALAEQRPIVFLTPHQGCFEVTAQWYAATLAPESGRPITVLYRVPRKEVLRKIVGEGRGGENMALAPADVSGVRKLMRALKNRETVGILPDQVPSQGEGVWAPFFGRPAYTMTLPLKFARQFDAIVLLVWGERLGHGQGWRIHAERLETPFSGEAGADAAIMNHALEAMIRHRPGQYLWGYNRYKVPAGVAAPAQEVQP